MIDVSKLSDADLAALAFGWMKIELEQDSMAENLMQDIDEVDELNNIIQDKGAWI